MIALALTLAVGALPFPVEFLFMEPSDGGARDGACDPVNGGVEVGCPTPDAGPRAQVPPFYRDAPPMGDELAERGDVIPRSAWEPRADGGYLLVPVQRAKGSEWRWQAAEEEAVRCREGKPTATGLWLGLVGSALGTAGTVMVAMLAAGWRPWELQR